MSTTPTKANAKRWLWLLAALPLASGAALVVHVVTNYSLGLALAIMGLIVIIIALLVWRRLAPEARKIVTRRARVGLVAGLLGTLAYDGSRWVIVTVFHTTFYPFDIFPIFGYAIAGLGLSPALATVIGILYHYTNGLMFALAYTILFGGRSWWIGILWALGLEALMLAVYPGWLHPKAIGEFVSISILGHVFYGSVLGYVSQQGLLWLNRRKQKVNVKV